MHPNPVFHWEDREAMGALVADIGFGTLFAETPDGPRVAHAPAVLVAPDRLRFHLARGNALHHHLDGRTALFVVNGPEAYVSPDWYGISDQVPTWNYLAVELEGPVSRLDDDALPALLDALSAQAEAGIAGKKPWTRDKMDQAVFSRMLGAVTAFEMGIRAWRGTAKLSQNKGAEVRDAAAAGLEATGRRAIAHLMRSWRP